MTLVPKTSLDSRDSPSNLTKRCTGCDDPIPEGRTGSIITMPDGIVLYLCIECTKAGNDQDDKMTDSHSCNQMSFDFIQAKDFINQHHSYIQWSDRPSRKMYWLLYEHQTLVGVFGLGSAFVLSKPMKDYILKNNLQFNQIANNIVYCLYGHSHKNSGTIFLKLLRIDAKTRWKQRYEDDLKLLQTFILPPRTGSLYKADNWTQIGITSGNSIQTQTLLFQEYENLPDSQKKRVQIKTFSNNQTRYILRLPNTVLPKLIFVRRV